MKHILIAIVAQLTSLRGSARLPSRYGAPRAFLCGGAHPTGRPRYPHSYAAAVDRRENPFPEVAQAMYKISLSL